MYEGAGDDAKSMALFAAGPIKQLLAAFKRGDFDVIMPDGTTKVFPLKSVLIGLGDGSYASSANMLEGHSGTYGCHVCEIPTALFMEIRREELAKYKERTLESIQEYGHMVSGIQCQGCGLHVVATQDEADQLNAGLSKKNHKAIRVCTGDPHVDPPQPKKWPANTGLKWGPTHKSVRYGGNGWYLLWAVDLKCWVICVLHLKLRVTAQVFAVCCLQWLDRGWKPTAKQKREKVVDGPGTEIVTALVNTMLSGRKIQKLEKVAKMLDKQVSGSLGGLAVQSYDGAVCNVLNRVRHVLLEVPFPSKECVPGSEMLLNKQRATRIWDSFVEYLELLLKPLECDANSDTVTVMAIREARALEVEAAGAVFVSAWKVLRPNSRCWYVHAMVAHVGDQIRRHGYLPDFSMEGLEAKHSTSKQILLRLSNSKQFQRIKTVMSHYTLRDATMASARNDVELADVLDYKEAQKVRRTNTRRGTTSRRVAARHADLTTSLEEAETTPDISLGFKAKQEIRVLKRKLEVQAKSKRALCKRSKK